MSADKKKFDTTSLASIYLKTNMLKSKEVKMSLRHRETQGELLINIKRNVLAKERKELRSLDS